MFSDWLRPVWSLGRPIDVRRSGLRFEDSAPCSAPSRGRFSLRLSQKKPGHRWKKMKEDCSWPRDCLWAISALSASGSGHERVFFGGLFARGPSRRLGRGQKIPCPIHSHSNSSLRPSRSAPPSLTNKKTGHSRSAAEPSKSEMAQRQTDNSKS